MYIIAFEYEGKEYTIIDLVPSDDDIVKAFFQCYFFDENDKQIMKLFALDVLKEIIDKQNLK